MYFPIQLEPSVDALTRVDQQTSVMTRCAVVAVCAKHNAQIVLQDIVCSVVRSCFRAKHCGTTTLL